MSEKPLRLIRLPEVIHKCGFGKSTLWKIVKEGNFPKPVYSVRRLTSWVESEVDAWIEEKMRTR